MFSDTKYILEQDCHFVQKKKKEKKRKPAGVLIGMRLNLQIIVGRIDNFINIESPNAQTRGISIQIGIHYFLQAMCH